MGDWVNEAQRKASILHEQIAAARLVEMRDGNNLTAVIESYQTALRRLYEEDFALARLLDNSDLIIRAEGPATEALPNLRAVNWLTSAAERQLRALSKSVVELSERDAKQVARSVDLRLSGLAPGSLYVGFLAAPPAPDLLNQAQTEPFFVAVQGAIRTLPRVPEYVEDNHINNAAMREAFPDAALRDAEIEAAYALAPTGRVGIHTLELLAPGEPGSYLSQRERVVLKEALNRPELLNRKHGQFVGQVREIDLDAQRFHLREVPGIGSIRCVLPTVDADRARELIGNTVRVEGDYESDRSGRPRLLLVNSVAVIPSPEQWALDSTPALPPP